MLDAYRLSTRVLLAVCSFTSASHAQSEPFSTGLDAYINADKKLVLIVRNDVLLLSGISFESKGEYVVPVPPDGSPTPFDFVVVNQPSVSQLASTPDIAISRGEYVTDIGYDPPFDGNVEVVRFQSDVVLASSDETRPLTQVCWGAPCSPIPEPSSFPLLLLGGVLVGLKGRKSRG